MRSCAGYRGTAVIVVEASFKHVKEAHLITGKRRNKRDAGTQDGTRHSSTVDRGGGDGGDRSGIHSHPSGPQPPRGTHHSAQYTLMERN